MGAQKYQSEYTERLVTAANYLVEIVCYHRSQQMEFPLPKKFWNDRAWKGYYIYQLKEAHKILESIEPLVAIRAAKESGASSLKMGKFLAMCRKFQKEADAEKKRNKDIELKIVTDSTGQFKKKENLPEDL